MTLTRHAPPKRRQIEPPSWNEDREEMTEEKERGEALPLNKNYHEYLTCSSARNVQLSM